MSNQKLINFSSPKFKRNALLILLWFSIFLALYLVRDVVLPFIVAILFAFVLAPLVNKMGKIQINNRPMPRYLSVLIIYLAIILVFVLVGAFFVPQFYREIIRLAKEATILINSIDEHTITDLGNKIEHFFRMYNLPLEIVAPSTTEQPMPAPLGRTNWISIDLLSFSKDMLNDILNLVKSETKNIIISAKTFITNLFSTLFIFMLILMITAFILVDIDRIKRFLFRLVPEESRYRFEAFLYHADQGLSGVVRGQFIICLINAILTLMGLLIFQVKFAFILATIAGIFSLVPIFGSIFSTIPIVLVALTMSPIKAFFILIWILAIHILEANLLNPKIMGDSAKIHPALIILALLTGEHFYGVIGALLAVPIMSILITTFLSILEIAKAADEGVAKRIETDRI